MFALKYSYQITEYVHRILKGHIEEGDTCIDATVGKGNDTGFEEKDSILSFLKGLDPKKYLVILSQYYNRENNPPIPAFVVKLK